MTEEKPRDIDGPSTNLVLSEMINNVLPELNKKDSKLGLSNENVSIFFVFESLKFTFEVSCVLAIPNLMLMIFFG